MANEVLKLGYDAGLATLARQDQNLASLRNRAIGLLSAATIAIAVGASVGIVNADASKGAVFPEWVAVGTLTLILVMSGLIAGIMWPIQGWIFYVEPSLFVQVKDEDEDTVRERVTLKLAEAISQNELKMARRYRLFRAAVLVVMIELIGVAATAVIVGR